MMRLGALTSLLVVAGWSAAVFAATSPTWPAALALAATGKSQCFHPDAARKTCTSLAAYRMDAAGHIQTTVISIMDGPTTMQMTAPVTIQAGKVCETLQPAQIEAATFFNAGAPVDATMTSQLRAEALSGAEDAFGHKICTAFIAKAGVLKAEDAVDGVRTSDTDQPVIWLSPGDGYRVSP